MDKEQFEAAVLAQLQAEIKTAGTSIPKLAAQLDYDYNTYWRYITGRRSIPLPVLFATIDALGITPALLMQEAERRMNR